MRMTSAAVNIDTHPLGLKAFIVCDLDWYAATSPENALALHNESVPDDSATVEHDVREASDHELDMPWFNRDEPGEPPESARQLLAKVTKPGWLTGTE